MSLIGEIIRRLEGLYTVKPPLVYGSRDLQRFHTTQQQFGAQGAERETSAETCAAAAAFYSKSGCDQYPREDADSIR